MTDANPSTDEIDAGIEALLALVLNYEASKLTAIERARLTWALRNPSDTVQEVLDEAATALTEQLAECACFVLNAVALEPDGDT